MTLELGAIGNSFARSLLRLPLKPRGLADNGSDMYITGTMDPNWDNDILNPAFHSLDADDFEVILLGWDPVTSGIE